MTDAIRLWDAAGAVTIPADANTAKGIAQYARQLNRRDISQISDAFLAGSYEMMSAFVWTKAMVALRKQLATLGMDFLGEMLGRSDVDEQSSVEQVVTEFDAIRLAEELGMVTGTSAMRLRQARELIAHFASSGDDDQESRMSQQEALSCLRACVEGVLAQPRVEPAARFAEFRRQLETRVFAPTDPRMAELSSSPYFFQRTILSVLITMLRTADGARLENAIGNVGTIIPLLWNRLRKTEKWQAGQTYAELHAAGKKAAVAGLGGALLSVHGFDYVPENLRSNTFTAVAQQLIAAHDSWGNFGAEPGPAQTLASLGTSIPMPAFALCMRAALSVYLGNPYGESFAAQDPVSTLLSGLPPDRWKYFLDECLPTDLKLLDKLRWDKPRARWILLARPFDLFAKGATDASVLRLLRATKKGDGAAVERLASAMVAELGYGQA